MTPGKEESSKHFCLRIVYIVLRGSLNHRDEDDDDDDRQAPPLIVLCQASFGGWQSCGYSWPFRNMLEEGRHLNEKSLLE